MKSLKESIHAVIDLGVILMIGIAFCGLAVLAYVVFTLRDQLWPNTPGATTTVDYNNSWNQSRNISAGFDNAIALILVAITIFILAIAISALLMLRGRQ